MLSNLTIPADHASSRVDLTLNRKGAGGAELIADSIGD